MISETTAVEQLAFLNHIQRLFNEGEFVATYKFALLISLTELAVEKGDETDAPLHIPLAELSTKFIELYWRQIKPYKTVEYIDAAVLIQNQGKQAAIPNLVAEIQARYPSLSDAKKSRQWNNVIIKVSNIIVKMPLWKLQTLRRQKVIFLYREELKNDGIELFNGVAYCLRQFNSFILQLARAAWVNHIRANPQNRTVVGEDNDLESFLFGVERGSLVAIRGLLTEIQNKKCFYCGVAIRDAGAVDHFIPWMRYPRDITQNFVLAHQTCNSDKSDLLAATKHLSNWRDRNESFRNELLDFSNASITSDEATCLGVARWAYGHAFKTQSQVWLKHGLTETLNNDFQQILK